MKLKKKIDLMLTMLVCLFLAAACGTDVVYETENQEESSAMQETEINENLQTAGTDPYEQNAENETELPQTVYVHVCGAVNTPGVYELPAGSRASDAVTAAGGFTGDAAQDSQNLARTLTDGEQLRIYTIAEAEQIDVAETDSAAESSGGGAAGESTKININQADLEALMTLNGIGEAKAEAILQYREETGMFACIEDIRNVSGIGEGIFNKIKEYITVN